MSLLRTDNIVEINDKKWQVYRTFKDTLLGNLNTDQINELTVELRCDTVFKKDGVFYFVIEIQDAEIVN